MKKILTITRNLPPLIGGMERLNWHIADELSRDHIVSIVSHAGAKKTAPPKTNFYGVPLNPLPIFLIFAFFKVFWVCIDQRPDILFAGSGLTAPIAVFWAKIFRKKSIVYIHGLDIENNSIVYRHIWIPFIRKADRIFVNSTPTQKLCIENDISPVKISIIHPGVDFPPRKSDAKHIHQLKDKFKLHDKKILISVGRLTERKGLNEFIQLALPQIVKAVPNVLLLIVGDTASHALNKNMQTHTQLLETAKAFHVENHIIFSGKVTDQALSSLFYLSDVHVFPVKYIARDPEGFGMVAIEAAAHGTPTISFANGGIIDAVQEGKTGYLIENGDYHQLSEKINWLLKNNQPFNKEQCQFFAQQFSWENTGTQLNALCETLNS